MAGMEIEEGEIGGNLGFLQRERERREKEEEGRGEREVGFCFNENN